MGGQIAGQKHWRAPTSRNVWATDTEHRAAARCTRRDQTTEYLLVGLASRHRERPAGDSSVNVDTTRGHARTIIRTTCMKANCPSTAIIPASGHFLPTPSSAC